ALARGGVEVDLDLADAREILHRGDLGGDLTADFVGAVRRGKALRGRGRFDANHGDQRGRWGGAEQLQAGTQGESRGGRWKEDGLCEEGDAGPLRGEETEVVPGAPGPRECP